MARGLAQLLATRALIKREIGVATTLIGGVDNNPLKLSVDEHEAVRSLIQHRGPGYLAAEDAIQNALDDIKAHELAVLDGIQAALETLLRRFDPAALEKEIERHSLFSRLAAGGRKAKYWELFKQHYGEIAKRRDAVPRRGRARISRRRTNARCIELRVSGQVMIRRRVVLLWACSGAGAILGAVAPTRSRPRHRRHLHRPPS